MFLQMASVYSLFFFFRSVGTLNWPVYSDHPGFPGGTVIKSLPADAGDARDVGSIPVLGRSPGVGNGRPLQYSCLGNPIDRWAWWTAVHRVQKSQTQLSDWARTHTHTHNPITQREAVWGVTHKTCRLNHTCSVRQAELTSCCRCFLSLVALSEFLIPSGPPCSCL